MRKILLLTVALLSLSANAAPARPAARPDAGKLAAAAQGNFAAGRYAEALTGFTEAIQLKQKPEYLLGIARCHARLGNDEPARDFYRRYLQDAPANAAAKGELAEVDAKLAKAERQRQATADLELVRARERAALAEKDLTSHQKELERAKTESARAEAEAAARRQSELEAANQLFAGADQEIADGNRVVNKWWFWTAVGAAAAGAVTVYVATAPGPRPATLSEINGR